jgi:hypothetical protein
MAFVGSLQKITDFGLAAKPVRSVLRTYKISFILIA